MPARIINNFFKFFGIQLKKIKALEIERNHYVKIINGAACILEVYKKYEGRILNEELAGLVFSKDRAMQLHALLTSYFEKVQNFCPLSILYKTTNEKSRQSYEVLKMEFSAFPIRFIEENIFNEQVKVWLATQSADRIFFMTDDAIFLDAFDMKDALLFNPLNEIVSLTKGKDLQYCFTKNVKQELPAFDNVLQLNGKSFNSWRWGDCPRSHDWAYPLSVDGTFFLREEMLKLVENISFKNPNTLEANMQLFRSFFLQRKGVCYDKVKMINVPCNLVQNEFNNRSTGFFKAEELQSLWDKGKRIDVKMFYGLSAFEAEHAKYNFIQNIWQN
jgi:hypothetical protein